MLILVYSSSDEDWSYCMYECGVATDPKSPHTNIIVFQCGHDSPSPFSDQLRVNARKSDDIRKFTKAFFTDPAFFPNGTTALAPSFTETQCNDAAEELSQKLGTPGVLPPLEVQPSEDVLAWPSLKLQVAEGVIEKIIASSTSKVHDTCEQLLREQASVIESTNRASLLFGMNSLPPNVPFSTLINRVNPGAEPGWLHCLTEQVRCLADRQAQPSIRWEPIKEVDGERLYTPIATMMRRIPSEDKVYFEVFFVELSNPRSVRLSERMIDLPNIYLKRLDEITKSMKLIDLRNEMNRMGRERLPVLSANDLPLAMIHRSMLERFLVDQQLKGTALEDLSFGEFYQDLMVASSEQSPESTFATLAPGASLAEAQHAMVGNIRDVFVTNDGSNSTGVVGWLDNVRLGRSL